MKNKILATLLVTLFGVQQSFAVNSGALSNEMISAESFAKLAVAAGGIDSHSYIYQNPALLGDISDQVSFGTSLIMFNAEREAPGISDEMDNDLIYVPNFGVTKSFQDGKWGVGLGIFSPFGLETKWKETSSVRFVATKSEMQMIDITPAVSFRPNEKFAIGAGLDYFKVLNTELQRKTSIDVFNAGICGAAPLTPGCPAAPGGTEGNSKLEGDGDQWGWHSGLVLSPFEKHDFAAAYQSQVGVELEGDITLTNLSGPAALAFGGTNFTTPGKADVFFPQKVTLGYGFTPTEKWHVAFDATWYDWSKNQELKPTAPNATAIQKAFIENPTPLQWKDVWSFALGTTHTFNEMWKLHGAIFHISSPVPDSTFNPSIPDSDKYGFTVGPTFVKGSLKLDGIFNYTFYKERTVNNNIGAIVSGIPSYNINGDYSADIVVLGLNASWLFGNKANN